MHDVDLSTLPPGSACAAVARSSRVPPLFVVADAGTCLTAARWRRHAARLEQPACLDDHVLSYCVRGGARSTVVIDGVHRHAQQQAGAMTFVPAGRPVQWLMEAPGEVEHVHLYIGANAARAHLPGAANGLHGLLNVRDPWLDGYFRLLIADVETRVREHRWAGFDLLARLADPLLQRVATLQTAAANDDARPSRVSPLRQAILERIEAHIEEHLHDDLHLPALAAIASMSVDHFVRAFQQATGLTPHRHLLERRLERACRLLAEDTQPVSVVAHHCGFAGAAHFSTAFRQRYGVTPTGFRRRA